MATRGCARSADVGAGHGGEGPVELAVIVVATAARSVDPHHGRFIQMACRAFNQRIIQQKVFPLLAHQLAYCVWLVFFSFDEFAGLGVNLLADWDVLVFLEG